MTIQLEIIRFYVIERGTGNYISQTYGIEFHSGKVVKIKEGYDPYMASAQSAKKHLRIYDFVNVQTDVRFRKYGDGDFSIRYTISDKEYE